jgi:hypothetical protein
VLKTFCSRSPKAIASIFLASGLFVAALVVPNPVSETRIAHAAAPTFDPTKPYVATDGMTIFELTSNTDLGLYPEPSSFTVTVLPSGPVIPVVRLDRFSGTIIDLILASAITPGVAVNVSYAAPTEPSLTNTNKALQDTAGNDASPFQIEIPVNRNYSKPLPAFGTAFQPYVPVDGKSVNLQLSNRDQAGDLIDNAPDPARFTVMVGTSPNPVTSVAILSGWILKMNVTNGITKGALVTVSYSAAGDTPNKIKTIFNFAASNFGPLTATNNISTYVQTVPNAPGASTVVAGAENATITVAPPTSGPAPTSYEVTASPGGAKCTVTGASGSCTISGLTAGTAYTFTTVAKTASGSSPAGLASSAITVLAKTLAPASGSNAPSWEKEPATDSETDAFTEGFWPSSIPGNIIITDEFGFTVDKKNGIKPKIRMKNYAGKIKMSISATYKDAGKNKKYKCTYKPFGSTKKAKTAKWKWYTPKKACILPKPLVTALQTGTTKLSANGKWTRIWVTSAKKARPDNTKIKARKLKYTVRAKPAAAK